jgi:hypothetical protein
MTIWQLISQKNIDKFRISGNIVYALKAIAAKARIPSRPKFSIAPTTVEDFFAILDSISMSGGSMGDPMQQLLNKQVARFLLAYLKHLPPETQVLRSQLPSNHLTGFIAAVLPFDKSSLQALSAHLSEATYPTEEISSMVKELVADNNSLKNILSFTLGTAFIDVIKHQIINNPILTVLPNNIVKVAAKKPFQSNGPRLNDLIEALRITHGRYLIEYNQLALADFMRGSSDFDNMFPGGFTAEHKKTLSTLPAKMMIMSSAYIRHYTELQRALHDYCWSNITDVNTKVISHSGEVLTPNIYINPGISDIKGVKSIANLLSKEQKLANLDLKMTTWNGQSYNVNATHLSMEDIRKHFISSRTYSDISSEIIDGSAEAIESARMHMRAQDMPRFIKGIAGLMTSPSTSAATDLIEEFITLAKEAVSKSIASRGNVFIDASTDAKKTYGKTSTGTSLLGTAFKTKDLDNILIINEDMLFSFEVAYTKISNKYSQLFKEQSQVRQILVNIFKSYAIPLLPMTMRYLYNAPSAAKIVDISSAPNLSEQTKTSAAEAIRAVTDDFLPQLSETLSSVPFQERYAANATEYNETVVHTDKISTLRNESLGTDINPSILQPILKHLGIDDAGIKSKQADIALAYSSMGRDSGRRTGEMINKIIADVMRRYHELSLQGGAGGVTWEHVSVYIGNKVLPGIIEEYITSVLSKKMSADTSERREEIENFINTSFMSLKSGRSQGTISSNTIYGKLSQLYEAYAIKQNKGEDASKLINNALGALITGADYGYRAERAAPAVHAVKSLLKRNKEDKSVTDENWSDPANPRPRSMEELAHITKAFADPIPDITSRAPGIVRKKRLNIQPGNRFSRAQVEKMNQERKVEGKGKIVEPTVHHSLLNAIRRLGNNLISDPISVIRTSFLERKEEILSVSPAYASDIIPYTKGGPIQLRESPFIAAEYIPPQVEVDFSTIHLDADRSRVVIDKSDESPVIKKSIEDLAKTGITSGVLQKIEVELRKLPSHYLTEKSIATTIEILLGKFAPTTIRPRVERTPAPAATSPTVKSDGGEKFIESLTKTIFNGNVLAIRLQPTAQDSVEQLNSKAEELMKYLHLLTQAQASLTKEIASAAKDPTLLSRLRDYLATAKAYRSHLLKAINKAKDLAERASESADIEEYDYIKETLSQSKAKLQDFISRMSKLPQYKDKESIVRKVSTALGSLVNVSDMADAINPQHIQLLLMDLNNKLSKGDNFDNIMLDIDKYRVRNTVPSHEREVKEDVAAVESVFNEQSERWESAIKHEQSQSLKDH